LASSIDPRRVNWVEIDVHLDEPGETTLALAA
jgi:hypothetical protein